MLSSTNLENKIYNFMLNESSFLMCESNIGGSIYLVGHFIIGIYHSLFVEPIQF